MRKIKWGVLGTAGIARGCTIPGMMLAENCERYAIAGRNKEKVDSFAEEFGFEKTYLDYEELLSDPKIEAVYIPLPNHLHYEWVRKAIEHGKHVLCEKPLAPTAKQAEELIEAANAKGVILMEAFAYLHSPYIAEVKKLVSEGAIGELGYIETAFITSDYSLSNIRMRRETFGGCLYDLGCYCTSMLLTMIGELPEEIHAYSEFSEEKIDLFTTAFLNYKNKVRASFQCGMILETEKDQRIDRLHIHGSDGYIHSDVEYNQCGELSYTICVNGETKVCRIPVKQNYALEIEQLGRCITEGEKPHVTHAFTIANARFLDRILEKTGYRTISEA